MSQLVVVATCQPPCTDTCHWLFADAHAELAVTAITKQTMSHLTKAGARLNLPRKAQEKGLPAKPSWQAQEQDPFLPVLEKVLLYSHFLLSLFFFATIFIKWSS